MEGMDEDASDAQLESGALSGLKMQMMLKSMMDY
jgi:hypothetical protein